MLERVISGGQTGVDLAAWRAARRFAIPTGGMMPRGFRAEDGPHPEYAALYGATEHPDPDYPPRTRANVMEADGTLLFALRPMSPGTRLTFRLLIDHSAGGDGSSYIITIERKGCLWLPRYAYQMPEHVAKWIEGAKVETLNVAGPRESRAPCIGAWAEEYLCEVFRLLGFKEVMDKSPPG